MRGRYLKSAERACAAKARFETKAEAERASEYRFRAYQCPICHHWHLTSQSGPSVPEPPAKPEPPLARLGDLEWKELKPRGAPRKTHTPKPVVKPETEREATMAQTAVVKSLPDRRGRVLILLEGKLVKSEPVRQELRLQIRLEARVRVDGLLVLTVVG